MPDVTLGEILSLATGARLTRKGMPAHWLHPIHGPLPELVAKLHYGEATFIGAVWSTERSFIVCVELIEPFNATPTKLRGRILQSFRWMVRGNALVNEGQVPWDTQITLKEVDEVDEREWRCDIYRQLLTRSVELAVTTKAGGYRDGQQPATSRAEATTRAARSTCRTRIPKHTP